MTLERDEIARSSLRARLLFEYVIAETSVRDIRNLQTAAWLQYHLVKSEYSQGRLFYSQIQWPKHPFGL